MAVYKIPGQLSASVEQEPFQPARNGPSPFSSAPRPEYRSLLPEESGVVLSEKEDLGVFSVNLHTFPTSK